MIRIVASGVVRDGCRTEFLRLAERLVGRVARRSGECFLRAVCVGRRTRTRRLFGGMEG